MNHAQLEFLQSLIGDNESIYLGTVLDNNYFNLGTILLYLERAVTLDCMTFLKSLDLLYTEESSQQQNHNLEFIRALKHINDICFNNEVRYDMYGVRRAAEHYFARLGDIDEISLKNTVKDIILSQINQIFDSAPEKIKQERQERETLEKNLAGNTDWRNSLNLPSSQLPAVNAPVNVSNRSNIPMLFFNSERINPQNQFISGLANSGLSNESILSILNN